MVEILAPASLPVTNWSCRRPCTENLGLNLYSAPYNPAIKRDEEVALGIDLVSTPIEPPAKVARPSDTLMYRQRLVPTCKLEVLPTLSFDELKPREAASRIFAEIAYAMPRFGLSMIDVVKANDPFLS
jgi:hypothetical protein